jgi:hypothetical protein
MINRRLYRFYQFSLYGALGGFCAACAHQYLFLRILSGQLTTDERYVWLALFGGAAGAAFGFFPGFVEGRGRYSLRGAMRSGLIGALLGGVGGLLTLPLSEWIHLQLGGGIRGRASALIVLGGAIGIAEGINGGARFWRGVTGGMVGGLLAGIGLELLLPHQFARRDIGVVALLLIGCAIAASISLFVNVLQDAWLEGLEGQKIKGRSYPLGKFREPAVAYIGSEQGGPVYICLPNAAPRHASLSLTPHGARIRHCASSGATLVRGSPARELILRDGDVIEIAQAKFRYRERRKTARQPASPGKQKATGTNGDS